MVVDYHEGPRKKPLFTRDEMLFHIFCNIRLILPQQLTFVPFYRQKNACALKIPRTVALPFIYGVKCIIISKCRSVEVFMCLFTLYLYIFIASVFVAGFFMAGLFFTMKPHWSIHNQAKEICETFFDLVSLTYDLDLRTWPRYPSTWLTYQRSDLYVCLYIAIDLWWNCSNDTRSIGLMKIRFTDPCGGLN